MSQETLLQEIDRFLSDHEMTETRFGVLSVNDGKFVPQLRDGRRCWPETEQKVRSFMESKRKEEAA